MLGRDAMGPVAVHDHAALPAEPLDNPGQGAFVLLLGELVAEQVVFQRGVRPEDVCSVVGGRPLHGDHYRVEQPRPEGAEAGLEPLELGRGALQAAQQLVAYLIVDEAAAEHTGDLVGHLLRAASREAGDRHHLAGPGPLLSGLPLHVRPCVYGQDVGIEDAAVGPCPQLPLVGPQEAQLLEQPERGRVVLGHVHPCPVQLQRREYPVHQDEHGRSAVALVPQVLAAYEEGELRSFLAVENDLALADVFVLVVVDGENQALRVTEDVEPLRVAGLEHVSRLVAAVDWLAPSILAEPAGRDLGILQPPCDSVYVVARNRFEGDNGKHLVHLLLAFAHSRVRIQPIVPA